jgi:hypothetical protein
VVYEVTSVKVVEIGVEFEVAIVQAAKGGGLLGSASSVTDQLRPRWPKLATRCSNCCVPGGEKAVSDGVDAPYGIDVPK